MYFSRGTMCFYRDYDDYLRSHNNLIKKAPYLKVKKSSKDEFNRQNYFSKVNWYLNEEFELGDAEKNDAIVAILFRIKNGKEIKGIPDEDVHKFCNEVLSRVLEIVDNYRQKKISVNNCAFKLYRYYNYLINNFGNK